MTGLGLYRTGAPVGVCSPPVVGLTGLIHSEDRIHEERLPGEAGLSTFSGSASTVRLGCSSRHICAESASLISDFSLSRLASPFRAHGSLHLWLFFCLSAAFLYCLLMFLGYAICLLFLILRLPGGLCLKLELSLLSIGHFLGKALVRLRSPL